MKLLLFKNERDLKKKQPEKKGEGRVIIKLKRIRITSSINYNGKLIIKLDFFLVEYLEFQIGKCI